jgi:hypothetical protein
MVVTECKGWGKIWARLRPYWGSYCRSLKMACWGEDQEHLTTLETKEGKPRVEMVGGVVARLGNIGKKI